jgi:hypothetical protein
MLRRDYPLCLLIALGLGTLARADEVDQLLRDVRAVSKQGAGSPAARAAWKNLVARGPVVLPRLLEALDTPDTVAANWLRTAFDRIVDTELNRGGKQLDAVALLAFVKDPKCRGRTRRLALEVVERLRPGTAERLLAGWLDDPEFRFDAIGQRLARLDRDKTLPRERAIAAYRETFAATRDVDQGRQLAARLKSLGVEVDVAEHLGFLGDWYVVGPFDAHGMKGFTTVYPPEKRVDLNGTFDGKDGKKLHWKHNRIVNTPALRFPNFVDLHQALGGAEDAVAYAFTSFRAEAPREVEFRGAADDNFTVWVNGERVFGFEEYRNGVRLDRHRFRARLRAGINTVLVKVCQAPVTATNKEPNWEFVLRITDLSGKGLAFATALPEGK